jgi:hypothetical protein
MSTHNDDLIAELKSARLNRRQLTVDLIEARAGYVQAKRRLTEADGIIDEILQQIETGKSGRPLMDAIAALNLAAAPEAIVNGQPATRDELAAAVRSDLAVEESRPDGAVGNGKTAVEMANQRTYALVEIDKELEDALYPAGHEGPKSPWVSLRELGATDSKILAPLGSLWPKSSRMYVPPNRSGGKHGYTIQGCPRPGFWMGSYKGLGHQPNLCDLALSGRVRQLLELPEASGPSAPPKARKGKPEPAGVKP